MSRHRDTASSRTENFGQYAPQVKKTSPAGVHTPRKDLTNASVSNQLHRTPVALAVSANGERTLCPVDASSVPMSLSNTNPFANEQKEQMAGESSAEEVLQSYPSKRRRAYQPRRRKLLEKEHRRSSKSMLTHRNSARPRPQVEMRSASSQTDPEVACARRALECVGDPGIPRRELYAGLLNRARSGPVCAVGENSFADKKLRCIDSLFTQLMPESLKSLTSFLIMIILIFWTTSVILDVDVLADFYRIAANYIRSCMWWQYRKQPQTNVEKCLEYVKNLFQ